jgi:hypothetical protein
VSTTRTRQCTISRLLCRQTGRFSSTTNREQRGLGMHWRQACRMRAVVARVWPQGPPASPSRRLTVRCALCVEIGSTVSKMALRTSDVSLSRSPVDARSTWPNQRATASGLLARWSDSSADAS